MSIESRLAKLEREHAPPNAPVQFKMCHLAGQEGGCEAPPDLSREDHRAWHEARGDTVFTLDLKAASAAQRYDVDECRDRE